MVVASSSSQKVNGFSVIPVSYSKSTVHYIYARTHVSGTKKDQKQRQQKHLPNGRTLFLVNVPPDATDRELVKFFKPAGTVEKVILDFDVKDLQNGNGDESEGSEGEDEDEEMDLDNEGPSSADHPRKRQKIAKDEPPKVVELPCKPHRTIRKTGLTAYVVFLDESSLDRALSLSSSSSSSKPRSWPSSSSEDEPHGLAHYAAVYSNLRPPLDSIQEHVDSYMELFEYNAAKEKQKSQYRKGEAIVDEDGFTLVTRGGAYGKTLGGGVAVASKQFQRTGASARTRPRKKEKKEKEGFYAFQKAEKQRSELINLKKKWEEDKAKVEKLRASRRFKPY